MPHSLPHNWISAYLDGELTPAELAEAERRLCESEDDRDACAAFQNLSGLIHSLPTRELPDRFSDVVLKSCERNLLLAEAGADAGPHPSNRTATTRTGTWSFVAGGLLATAALVFVSIRAMQSPPERFDSPRSDFAADRRSNSPDEQSPLAAREEEEGEADRTNAGSANRGGAVRSQRGQTVAGGMNVESPQLPGAGSNRIRSFGKFADDNAQGRDSFPRAAIPPGGRGANPTPEGIGVAPAFGAAGIADANSRSGDIRLGDVLPYLEISGERTAVVEVTVIDVRESASSFETLLSLYKVHQPGGPANVRGRKGRNAEKLPMKRSGDREPVLIAVYVESSKTQMADVMAELGRKTGAVHVALRPPVDNAAVRLADSSTNDDRPGTARGERSLADAIAFSRSSLQAPNAPFQQARGGIAAAKPADEGGKPKPDAEKKKETKKTDAKKTEKKTTAAKNKAKLQEGKSDADGKDVEPKKDAAAHPPGNRLAKQSQPPADASAFRLRFEPAVVEAEDGKGKGGAGGRRRSALKESDVPRESDDERAAARVEKSAKAKVKKSEAPESDRLRVMFLFRKQPAPANGPADR